MKKRVGIVLALSLLASLSIHPRAYASHTDAFTFFVPYPADKLQEFFAFADQNERANPPFDVNAIQEVISISVFRSGGYIYYDHWEDGLEPNGTFVTQASTEVWGDSLLSNGAPPGVGRDQDDVLAQGQIIALRNVVPVPRNPADRFYDGGDKIMAVGSALAVTFAVWPEPDGGILFAGAWELYPTSRWGVNYVIPVGQDVPRPGEGYTIVGFNVQAAEDGTTVDVDLDPDQTGDEASVVLNEGQSYTVISGAQAGATITASEPVQVHLFTKDPQSTYQARADTMLPRGQWSNDYLAPRTSDGDIWLYNPHDSQLEVSIETITGTASITIAARSPGRYPPLPQPFIGTRTGARLRSTDGREFFGLAALDERDFQDWGYTLLPIRNLTTQALVGWAPGYDVQAPPGSITPQGRRASRVYVTAVTTTTVIVEYGNGAPADRISISPLAEVDIIDTTDFDMTGARLHTEGEPFVAVWGQDQDAPPEQPSIDVGTDIVPLPALAIQKTYNLIQEGYACNTAQRAHALRFKLVAFNDSIRPIADTAVIDNLPEGIRYLPGTTTIERSENPGVVSPIPDDPSGSPFPLDDPGYSMGTLPPLGSITIMYDAVIEDADAAHTNRVDLRPAAEPAIVRLRLPFRAATFEISKSPVNLPGGPVNPGQVIDFNVTITNTGNISITQLPVRDEFDPSLLTFRDASIAPTIASTNAITWTDLTTAVGDVLPGGVVSMAIRFRVADPLPPGAEQAFNLILAEGVQGSDGFPQRIKCAQAGVSFVPLPGPTPGGTPTPTTSITPTPSTSITLTPTPTRPTEREDTPTPAPTTPPPPPPPPPPTSPSSQITPTPAVVFLPETGVGSPGAKPGWPFIVWPGVALLLGWALARRLGGGGKRD